MIKIETLNKIYNQNGHIFHFIKNTQNDKLGGEIYFTQILNNKIKAWKYHKKATINLSVVIGEVKFVFFDENTNNFVDEIIGQDNYKKIIIPPKIWFGFKGLGLNYNLIVSFSNYEFDETEVDRKNISEFNFDWGNK